MKLSLSIIVKLFIVLLVSFNLILFSNSEPCGVTIEPSNYSGYTFGSCNGVYSCKKSFTLLSKRDGKSGIELDKYNHKVVFGVKFKSENFNRILSVSMLEGGTIGRANTLVQYDVNRGGLSDFKNNNEIYVDDNDYTFRYSNSSNGLLYKTIYSFNDQLDDSKNYYAMKSGSYPGLYNYKSNVRLYQDSDIDQIRVLGNYIIIKKGEFIYYCSPSAVNGNIQNDCQAVFNIPSLYQFDITNDYLYYSTTSPAKLYKLSFKGIVDTTSIILNYVPDSFHYHAYDNFIYYSYNGEIFKLWSNLSNMEGIKLFQDYYEEHSNIQSIIYKRGFTGNCVSQNIVL